MRVSDILKVKGNTLFTVTPDTSLAEAVDAMAAHDIGSLVVIEYGDLVGMLTFREIIVTLRDNGGSVGTSTIARSWTIIRSPVRRKPTSTKCAA